jgi:hypothetical protein
MFGAVGIGAAVMVSRIRGRESRVSMHPDDWRGLEEGATHRRYRNLEHALHHTKEVMGLLVPTCEVYLGRAISPAFREQIMTTKCHIQLNMRL